MNLLKIERLMLKSALYTLFLIIIFAMPVVQTKEKNRLNFTISQDSTFEISVSF